MIAIRQSKFAEDHKLLPGEVKDLREKFLVHGEDWWKDGVAILWKPEAAEKIHNILNPTNDHPEKKPEAAPEFITVRIIKAAKNARFVYGNLNGERISVFAGKSSAKIVGKPVRVKVTEENGAKSYFYQP